MARKRVRPQLKKFKHVGKYVEAYFKFLKQEKVFKSVREFGECIGYECRGGVYWLFSGKSPLQLKNIDLFRNVLSLDEKETRLLILMIHFRNSQSSVEKKLFKDLISNQKRVM